MNWVMLTFIDLLCVTVFVILYKYISIKVKGNNQMRLRSMMLVFMCVGVFACIGFLVIKPSPNANLANDSISFPYLYIVGAALFLFIAHSLHMTVYGIAPNQGVVHSLLGMSAVTVSIMSYFLFKDAYSPRKCIGIILSVISIFILVS